MKSTKNLVLEGRKVQEDFKKKLNEDSGKSYKFNGKDYTPNHEPLRPDQKDYRAPFDRSWYSPLLDAYYDYVESFSPPSSSGWKHADPLHNDNTDKRRFVKDIDGVEMEIYLGMSFNTTKCSNSVMIHANYNGKTYSLDNGRYSHIDLYPFKPVGDFQTDIKSLTRTIPKIFSTIEKHPEFIKLRELAIKRGSKKKR